MSVGIFDFDDVQSVCAVRVHNRAAHTAEETVIHFKLKVIFSEFLKGVFKELWAASVTVAVLERCDASVPRAMT